MATDATGTPSTNFSIPKYLTSADAPSGKGLNAIVDFIDTLMKKGFVILTTTGDLPYASAANTTSRLPIGSTGNVLTVAGGVPTWAAPASVGVTITGTVSSTGTVVRGSGFSSVRNSTGSYTVTFTSAFAAIPIIMVTQIPGAVSSNSIGIGTPATTGFNCFSQTGGVGPTDVSFSFVAQTTI